MQISSHIYVCTVSPYSSYYETLVNFGKSCIHFLQHSRKEKLSLKCKCKFAFDFIVAERCFSKVKFDDASKLLARVPIFLQNDTPFSFPTNQKVSFWGKSQTVVTFSLNRCSMCTPSPQVLCQRSDRFSL